MIKKAFSIFNFLSLNVVLGAVFSSWMFWKLPDGTSEVDLASILLLGMSTWLIYILDRLLDLKIYPENPSSRHRFHADNHFNLSLIVIVMLLLCAVLCFFIPKVVLFYGIYISVGLLVYFLVLHRFLKNQRMQWLKEPATAIFYTLAVVGIAFVYHSSINLSAWILAFMFFLIVSQNLLVFSYFESLGKENVENTIGLFGAKSSLRLIRILGFLVLFMAIFLFSSGWDYINKMGLLFAIMAQVLSFLPARPGYFFKNEKYRWVGDGVFILPVLLLLF